MYEINITDIGLKKFAQSISENQQLHLSTFRVSDQFDDMSQSAIIFESAINAINVYGDEISISCIIPEMINGVYLRHISLVDDKNEVIALGNLPEFYKPNFEDSPTVCDYTIKLKYLNAEHLNIQFDSQVYASQSDYYQLSASLINLMNQHIKHIWPIKE